MQCNRSTTSGPPASWMPMPLSNQNPRRRPDASTPMRACIGPSTGTGHGRQEALPRRPERFVQSLERRQISTCHHLRTHKHKHLRARAGSSGPWKLTNGARPPGPGGGCRLHQTHIDRSVPGFQRPVYSHHVPYGTMEYVLHSSASSMCRGGAAIAGSKRTQEPSLAGVVRCAGPAERCRPPAP